MSSKRHPPIDACACIGDLSKLGKLAWELHRGCWTHHETRSKVDRTRGALAPVELAGDRCIGRHRLGTPVLQIPLPNLTPRKRAGKGSDKGPKTAQNCSASPSGYSRSTFGPFFEPSLNMFPRPPEVDEFCPKAKISTNGPKWFEMCPQWLRE